MAEVTKAQLLAARAGSFDTERLRFDGLRGDARRHLDRAALEAALEALPPAPLRVGRVSMMVARGPGGERHLPQTAVLTVDGGMPGDRWAGDERYGPGYQLATMREDFARIIANGQPPQLHGDNLYLSLDLSDGNLPTGSRLRAGEAELVVTPVAHNGCKKWAQRFGLAAMQLNMAPAMRGRHLRGIYLRVVLDGEVRVGDRVEVIARGPGGG